jgi:Tfp pilus assembly protein PilP
VQQWAQEIERYAIAKRYTVILVACKDDTGQDLGEWMANAVRAPFEQKPPKAAKPPVVPNAEGRVGRPRHTSRTAYVVTGIGGR